jgi:hypothetical protein
MLDNRYNTGIEEKILLWLFALYYIRIRTGSGFNLSSKSGIVLEMRIGHKNGLQNGGKKKKI